MSQRAVSSMIFAKFANSAPIFYRGSKNPKAAWRVVHPLGDIEGGWSPDCRAARRQAKSAIREAFGDRPQAAFDAYMQMTRIEIVDTLTR